MDAPFWMKTALSFIAGGFWIGMSTRVAERFGSRRGGLLAGFPSTLVVSLFFIGLTQNPEAAANATGAVPLIQGINGLFILLYLFWVRRSFVLGLGVSLLFWLLAAAWIVYLEADDFVFSLILWAVLTGICFYMVHSRWTIPPVKIQSANSSWGLLLLRMGFGGTLISLAVIMARVSGPVFGGVLSTFPAMFISTLVITYRSGGAEFSRAVAKSMMVSGMINITLYAVLVRGLYPCLGLARGTVAALVITAAVALVRHEMEKRFQFH